MSEIRNEELPTPRRSKRRNDDLPMRHDYRSQGRVGVYVFILGAWRIVYSDDNRARAEEWAHANVRKGSAVTAIELREPGRHIQVIWRAA